jgi:predicted transposase YdaD
MTAPSPPGGPGLVANPQADLRARVELAEATLVRSTRKAKREVLAAKLRLATKERSTQVGEEIARLGAEMAARNNYNSGARLESCWTIAITRTREAADVVIKVCLELGIEGQHVGDFVALDAEHFLTERALAGC